MDDGGGRRPRLARRVRLPLSALLFHAVGFPATIDDESLGLLIEIAFFGVLIVAVGFLEGRDWSSRLSDWWSRRVKPGLRRTILEYVLLTAMLAVIVGIAVVGLLVFLRKPGCPNGGELPRLDLAGLDVPLDP